MNHILYPTFYARTDSDQTKISKSLVDLVNWGKAEGARYVTVRRFDPNGAVCVKPLFVYEFINGRPVRIG